MKLGFTGKKYRALFIAALLGWIVSLVGGMADSVIAGIFLDSDAVAAVGLVVPVYSMEFFFAYLVAGGIAIRYSTELGAFNIEKSRKIAGMGLIAALGTGVLIGGTMFLMKPVFLSFYNCSESILNQASSYYDIFIIIAMIDPLIYTNYYLITYDGDEKTALAFDVEVAVLNAVCSTILVQKLGVRGLALGTVIAESIGLIILLFHYKSSRNSIRFTPYFSFKELFGCLKLSSAGSLTYLYTALVDIIMNKVIIEFYGDSYLPAYTVVNAVINVAAVFCCAGNAGSCFTAIAYGEGNYNAVKRNEKRILKLATAVGLIFTALLLLISSYWPSLYGITDPAIMEAAIFAGRIIPLSYIMYSYAYSLLIYYPLIGRPIEGNILSVGVSLVFPLLLSIPLGKIFGFNGMCCGFMLTPIACMLALLIYFIITKQIKNAPLLLPAMEEEELLLDIKLTPENIVEARDKAGEFLKAHNVSSSKIMDIQMIYEDTLMKVIEKNKRKTFCECVILVNDDHVRMITKDNGIIFDITQEADDSLDLSCYVMARMMETASEKSNTTTASFNRNTFQWNLQ